MQIAGVSQVLTRCKVGALFSFCPFIAELLIERRRFFIYIEEVASRYGGQGRVRWSFTVVASVAFWILFQILSSSEILRNGCLWFRKGAALLTTYLQLSNKILAPSEKLLLFSKAESTL
jgi:hypothetical protein